AVRCGMYYVNHRWLGGLLTNNATIQKSITRLRELDEMSKDGRYDLLTKKEVQKLERERKHLEQNLAGIKDMPGLPDVMFVVDSHSEEIAVKEARKLGIPVVAVVDNNCDPDEVDYVIPGNDDALRAIRLFTTKIADAVAEARSLATEHEFTTEKIVSDETPAEETPAEYQQYLDPKYAEQLMSESLATSEEPEVTPRKGPASEAVEELAGSSLNEH